MVDKGERTQEKDKKDARRSRGNTGTIHVTDPGNLRKRKYQVNGSGQRCQMQKEDQVKKKESKRSSILMKNTKKLGNREKTSIVPRS